MFAPLVALAFAAVAPLAAADPDAWHMDNLYTLSMEQLDPILYPNQESQHMHLIFGGSNFGASYNYDTYSEASCTSVGIQIDKSNYWMPQLYYYEPDADKPYTPLRSWVRFYYFLTRSSSPEYVTAWPKGLRMYGGNPYNKAKATGISIGCLLADKTSFWNGTAEGFNFPVECPGGIKAEVYFPQCWDGVNLFKTDMSHMSYPVNTDDLGRDGACPWSHPVRLPTILIEAVFYPSEIAPGVAVEDHLIWANGDTTGWGWHSDFVNGWNVDILQEAMSEGSSCVDIYGDLAFEDCEFFSDYYDTTTASTCEPALGTLQEPQGNALYVAVESLPGCNLPWASGDKPTCDPAVATLDVTAFQGTDGAYVADAADQMAYVWPTTSGWHEIYCFYADTAFNSTDMYSYLDADMTVERCQTACLDNGYVYAGLEVKSSSYTCQCGNAILDTAMVQVGMCNEPCPGNSSETCGGQYALDVWWAGPNATASNDAEVYVGCLADSADGLRQNYDYMYQSNDLTTETCMQACVNVNATWSMTHSGLYCYCGTEDSLLDGGLVPNTFCETYMCRGNTSEYCGGAAYGMLYNLTYSGLTNSDLAHHAGWEGCWSKPSTGLALNNESWYSNSLTIDNCVDGCYELGYGYAAVSAGYQCMCGDTFYGVSRMPESECTTACRGNTSQTCGSSFYVELYTTSASTLDKAAVAAAHPTGWLGCYADSGSTVPFSDYSYTNSKMTAEICREGCGQFGYAYAATSGTTCVCGKTAPASLEYPYYFCSTTCAGNSSETCGASGYADAYIVTVASSTNSSANATATASSAAATATSTTSGATYKGCYQDTGVTGLTGFTFHTATMTVEMCTSGCKEIGYSLAALESGYYCYCGNTWAGGAQLPESSCSTNCYGNSAEKCGAGSIASLYDTTNAAAPANKSSTWVGCYADTGSTHLLTGSTYNTQYNGAELCQTSCKQQGFSLSGVEGGNGCYCGNAFSTTPSRVPSGLCQTGCLGNTAAYCGGSGYIDVYNATIAASAVDTRANSLGCYVDFSTALSTYTFQSDAMTIELCEQTCKAKNTTVAGVRSSTVCSCGSGTAMSIRPISQCQGATCGGNSSELCPTGYASMYNVSGSDVSSALPTTSDAKGYMACYASTAGYPITYSALSNYGTLTNELCQNSCHQLGYAYSGTQNGKNCYCGNTLDNTNFPLRVLDTDCSTACSGDSTETCGYSNKMSLYDVAKAIAARTATTTTTSSASTATSANSTATASATNSTSSAKTSAAATTTTVTTTTPEGLIGCYSGGHFMTSASYTTRQTFVDTGYCRRTCHNQGYTYAGLTGGYTCGCANAIPATDSVAASAACNVACYGNSTEYCGGTSSYTSIYDTTGAGALPASGHGSNYVGCYSRDTNSATSTTYAALTTQWCTSYCGTRGYPYSAPDAGNYCFCYAQLPTLLSVESNCATKCAGDPTEICGGSNMLSVYKTNTTSSSSSAASSSSVASSTSASKASSTSSSVTATLSTASASKSSSASASVSSGSVFKSASASSSSVTKSASASSSVSSSASSSASKSASSSVSSSASASKSSSLAASTITLASASGSASDSHSTYSHSTSIAANSSASPTALSASASSSSSLPASSSASASRSASASSASSASASSSATNSSTADHSTYSHSTSLSASGGSASSLSPAASFTSSILSSSRSTQASSVTAVTTTPSSASSSKASASSSSSAKASSASSASSASLAAASAASTDGLIGCFYANTTTEFTAMEMTCTSLTPDMCRSWCAFNQYTYAGLTDGDTCACAASLAGAAAAPVASCAAACTGDKTQTCGGSGATDVWNATVTSSPKAKRGALPAPATAPLPAPFRHRPPRHRLGM
ncbi:hypothetical protein Q5752_001081 [Cryptotrichosporon argae]